MVSKNDNQRTGDTLDTETKQASQESQTARDERENLQQTAQAFMRSLFQAGTDLAKLPIQMLPQPARGHFLAAGREFSQGLSKLASSLADELDKMAKEEQETKE